ncbi:uncharacterized protein LOC129190086 [Dunckerocampus dactyliophorus]|uniref:uncharacterized protein LOC129190086 n=1 Tax=Dunckerocampus dactyliophorus TaxID=161453 RepID=UPI0024069C26|nr:uncharacterized protein LOC129190086 [Dunckerocampus dactyliophorus]XP_054648435.1 uncharacterized protein LOC129190086 [Dunckerocampus dactyliophorus]
MKPVTYQSFPTLVYGAQPPVLVHSINSSVMARCDKCGFASSDVELFKRHVLEHTAAKPHYSFCQKTMFSKEELDAHLQQHIKHRFTCPHCGQSYMRNRCMLKHIERVHNKNSGQGHGMTKNPQVSNTLPSAEPSTRQPVGVNVPTLNTHAVRLNKDAQITRTVNTKVINHPNGVSNNVTNHNRALTVSLPDEVSIPPGCLVELVEVKTVNGSKELKLRLVSQQENESVRKDTRTAVEQNLTAGTTLAPKLNPPNATNSRNMGMCFVSKKQFETRVACPQRSAVIPVSTSKSLVSNQAPMKRTSQEVINLADCPNKVSKMLHNPIRERMEIPNTWNRPVPNRVKPDAVIFTSQASRVARLPHLEKKGLCVSQQKPDERLPSIPERQKSIPVTKAVMTESSFRDLLTSVKVEPDVVNLRENSSKIKNTPAGINVENQKSTSLNVSSGATVRVAPPTTKLGQKLGQDSATPQMSFPVPSTLRQMLNESSSVKASIASSRSKSSCPTWPQGVRSMEKAPEPKSFPVISSVFSLSQQPEEGQGTMQPLVMALRGIDMDKLHNTESLNPAVDIRDRLAAQVACGPVKVEGHDKMIEHLPVPARNDIKEEDKNNAKWEKNSMTQTEQDVPCLESKNKKSVCNNESYAVSSSAVVNPVYDISKFLTVSLMRVDECGAWMSSGNEPEPAASKCDPPTSAPSVRTEIQLMPLKVDQLVTWPGPDQPVVILNHPKPRSPVQETVDKVTDTGSPEKPAKCQILKMRLSKVMGQKYEVMGCTVRVSP